MKCYQRVSVWVVALGMDAQQLDSCVRRLLEARLRGWEVGAAAGWAPSARAQWQGSKRNEDSESQRLRKGRDLKPGCSGAGSASRLPNRATAPETSRSPQVQRGGDVREEQRAREQTPRPAERPSVPPPGQATPLQQSNATSGPGPKLAARGVESKLPVQLSALRLPPPPPGQAQNWQPPHGSGAKRISRFGPTTRTTQRA